VADLLVYARDCASPSSVRHRFQLAKNTRIIAVGVARDDWLERWWADFRQQAAFLQQIDVAAVTVPNFSVFTDAPRHQTLIHIARMHHFAERLTNDGLSVIPHLYAETPEDWGRWAEFLSNQRHVRFLAVEFQTGLRVRRRAIEFIQEVANLQRSIGRPLHLLAIGGARYVPELQQTCASFTVLDSQPFMKALYRRAYRHLPPHDFAWVRKFTRDKEPIDALFEHNMIEYPRRLDRARANEVHSLAA
jgi:hypothetical protein